MKVVAAMLVAKGHGEIEVNMPNQTADTMGHVSGAITFSP
jgi:hypothetical protein